MYWTFCQTSISFQWVSLKWCLLNGMVWFLQVVLQRQEEGEVPLQGQEPQTFEILLSITEVLTCSWTILRLIQFCVLREISWHDVTCNYGYDSGTIVIVLLKYYSFHCTTSYMMPFSCLWLKVDCISENIAATVITFFFFFFPPQPLQV